MTSHPPGPSSDQGTADRDDSDAGAGDTGPGDAHAGDAAAADADMLWSLCLAIAEGRRAGLPRGRLTIGPAGTAVRSAADGPPGRGRGMDWRVGLGWQLRGHWSAEARTLFDLYRPLLDVGSGQRYLIGHLGQSIDGRIATSSGDSCFINGQENLVHMHRLRALCDAVLVGAGTVVADDPQLTTRLVPGPHPTRVVLDPSRRLTAACRLCSDDRSPTLVARYPHQDDKDDKDDEDDKDEEAGCGRAEIVHARRVDGAIDLESLLAQLADRGLHAILVEGGGITVSRFLAQRLLDRLQIAIAPLIIGSGRQGLQLPEVLALSDCLRPSCRHHRMGEDVLWDLELRGRQASGEQRSVAAP